jgi:Ca2+-binding RTX toxin-like protein
MAVFDLSMSNPAPARFATGWGDPSPAARTLFVPGAIASGTEGSDALSGGDGDDQLYGKGGNDGLDGGAGNDLLDGGAGDDRMAGRRGNDTLYGAAGDDWLFGDEDGVGGSDRLFGGEGDDWLVGGDHDDLLHGSDGDDELDGGTGGDTMEGGYGDDAYHVDDGRDLVVETGPTSAGGVDTVFAHITHTLAENVENLTLAGSGNLSGWGNTLANRIEGNDAANALLGLEGNDTLRAFKGNDFLYGGVGNDLLIGGEQADSLFGNAGSDTLRGGYHPDILIGGLGNDVFDFDNVKDSEPGARDVCRGGDDGVPAFQGAGVSGGDRIDLSGIDANATAGGNQAFVFGGTGLGRLSAVNSGSNTLIRCNTDKDAAFEFELLIEDGGILASAYKAIDFIL